jgi:hypothetical protein
MVKKITSSLRKYGNKYAFSKEKVALDNMMLAVRSRFGVKKPVRMLAKFNRKILKAIKHLDKLEEKLGK